MSIHTAKLTVAYLIIKQKGSQKAIKFKPFKKTLQIYLIRIHLNPFGMLKPALEISMDIEA